MSHAPWQEHLDDDLQDAARPSTVLSGPKSVDLNALERTVLNQKRFKMLRAAVNDDTWLSRIPAEILTGVCDGLRGFYNTDDLKWLERLAQRVAASPMPIAAIGRSSIFATKLRHYRNK
jgi:hypothetical protein